MSVQFRKQLLEYHRTVLHGPDEELLDHNFRERLAYLIEAMTNMDSNAKQIVFDDLVSCYPKLDYEQIASTLKR
jgi:hypothetical protein